MDINASSTCELLARFFFCEKTFRINSLIAKELFIGIVTDTGRFLHGNSTSLTFKVVSKLLQYDFDTQKIYKSLYTKPLKLKQLQGYVSSKFKVLDNNIAYFLLSNCKLKKFDVPFIEASSLSFCLMETNEIEYGLYAIYNKEKKY